MTATKQTRKPALRARKEEDIRQAIERFREKALELGASAAAVIPASEVMVEERVRMKCLVPRCSSLGDGGTPYCPPHSPEPEFMRKVFSQYRWAVVFKRDITMKDYNVSTSEAERQEMRSKGLPDVDIRGKGYEIVGRLESYAQSEGYSLALGFAGGSCKGALCLGKPCAVFQTGTCRFPLRARPSMEGVGIDVFGLVQKVGWDIYMIRSIEPEPGEIPGGMAVGIVFVC
ncbi:MAG: DUF2284 domain-containing protein [Chloroflexi bacterium]|nr:DUF2284 domain-containing protein [Chloroflexota bacterium]